MDRLTAAFYLYFRFSLILVWLMVIWPGNIFSAGSKFGGVGLQVVPTIDGNLVVLRVVEGTPAEKEQIKPGDLIYQVDDFVLKGSDFGQVVADHLWGAVGSQVTLHYRRPGVSGNRSVVLHRIRLSPQLTVSPAVSEESSTATKQEK